MNLSLVAAKFKVQSNPLSMFIPMVVLEGGHIGCQIAAVVALQGEPLHVFALNVAAHVCGVATGVAALGALPATHHPPHTALHGLTL
jgi:hypothetical protein